MSDPFVDKIKNKIESKKDFTDDKYINDIYSEYSKWARHYHLLIWTIVAFGVSIALYASTYYSKLDSSLFTILGIFILAFLYIIHYFAQANRLQWSECKEVANWIEIFLQARDGKNPDGPLIAKNKNESKRTYRVYTGRVWLFRLIGIFWIAMIILKWCG